MSILENFEAKFSRMGDDDCWEWQAARTDQGYGQFGYRGMMQGAHRVAYELYVGKIPEGLHVLHNCDNPSCVNPGHLYTGTNLDNVRDRQQRGRTARLIGTSHHNAAFTEEQLKELRNLAVTKFYTHRQLAKYFGVSKTTVSYALSRKTYSQ